MGSDALLNSILWALDAGLGWVIMWCVDRVKEWKAEDGEPLSPKTARRLTYFFSAAVPTVLYLALVLLFPAVYHYDGATNVGYILGGFVASQVFHGEARLPSGPVEASLPPK